VDKEQLLARYAAADRLMPHRWPDLVFRDRITPTPIGASGCFWYVDRRPEGRRFVLVDPAVPEQRPAFDHERLAASLAEVLHRPVEATDLPFDSVHLEDDRMVVAVGEVELQVDLASYQVSVEPWPGPARHELLSPDRTWVAFVRDHDLWVRERASGAERQLTSGGTAVAPWATSNDITSYRSHRDLVGYTPPPVAVWSPDSTRLVTHRMDQTGVTVMHLVQSSPPDGGRPRLRSYRYPMLHDEHVPMAQLAVCDVRSGEVVLSEDGPFPVTYTSPLLSRQAWWSEDGSRVHWVRCDRAQRTLAVVAMDPGSGSVSTLAVEEREERAQLGPWIVAPVNVRVLASGEVLTWSERTGWGHLLLDGRPVTSGEWAVLDVVGVDENARTVTFTATGRRAGADPYVRDLCRVHLDTGELEELVADGLDHDVAAVPGGFLVDVASYVDQPPVSTLRAADGSVVLELCRADGSRLVAAGWQPPERFCATAADGTRPVWGLLYRPHELDETGSYPVLDDNYPGPQVYAGHVRYPEARPLRSGDGAGATAALGFATVVIDGRGTPGRGRAYQDATRGKGLLANLEDHVAVLDQLAATRPWMDLTRVGIHGHSGGGLIAARALLRFPDRFHVGVAVAGGHDDRIYNSSWGELVWDSEEGHDYEDAANATHAANLRGKLLLVHGELDDNVTPYVTLRLVDALMAADKDVDLMIVPNADHLLTVHEGHWRRRMLDYLVQHLMGETPPGYSMADLPRAPRTG
jgi:dipeptidyl aminopeptidase/acylaminoacyl peptidase